ncbi:MAG: hypothetical protein ACTSW1_09085 [Candidatus Hodarchaeales archaeon]
MFFKDYQVEALNILWDTGGDLSSREVWEGVNNRFGKKSRASIINFLNDMYEADLITGYETTGKGGTRMIYSPKYSEDDLKTHLGNLVIQKMKKFMQ